MPDTDQDQRKSAGSSSVGRDTTFSPKVTEGIGMPLTQSTITPMTMVRVPNHVVSRAFANETVVLNLNTGLYHSLNPTGGRMLEVLGELGSVHAAVDKLAAEYDQTVDSMRQDVYSFCVSLAEQGLVEVYHGHRRVVP